MDPFSIAAIVGGIGSLFSSGSKTPTYQAPKYTPGPSYQGGPGYQPGPGYQTNYNTPQLGNLPDTPQYQQDEQGTGIGNNLNSVIAGQLGRYSQGQPILDPNYRNAVLNQAKSTLDLSARESANQANEQYNQLNLLGSTGHGQALGEVQRARQQALANVNDNLTQQELQQLNNATNQGMSLQQAFQQRGNTAFQNQLAGAQYGTGNAQTAFGAGMEGYNAINQQNQYGYGQGQQDRQYGYSQAQADRQFGQGQNQQERQFGYNTQAQGAQQEYQSQLNRSQNNQNLGLGVAQLGAGLYGMGRGGGNNYIANMMGRRNGGGGPVTMDSIKYNY